MKRDIELLRRLLLDLEASETALMQDHPVSGYSNSEVAYHLGLIVRARLADGPEPTWYYSNATQIPDVVLALRLTPAGHDFIDTLRDERVWSRVKEKTAKVGSSLSLDVLKAVGTEVAKHLVGIALNP